MRIMANVPSPTTESTQETVDQERRARSLALEKAYVHDVYDQIAEDFTNNKHKAWPRVKQFLLDLEPGSIVADIGCGNGKYLNINPAICIVGLDRCNKLVQFARVRPGSLKNENTLKNPHQVVVSDNLSLPFREEAFDAVLSIAVIHHFSTTERRVQALRELARVLRIGGKVIISVWAKEQRHRKFESQDVLVPWHREVDTSSEDCGSSVDCDPYSTTTSDDDILTYHAHAHNTSDSGDSGCKVNSNPLSRNSDSRRKQYQNGSYRKGAKSVFPFQNSSQSSSDLSSPNETCYSFVRKALKRFSSGSLGTGSYGSLASLQCYRTCKRSWMVSYNSFDSDIPSRPHQINDNSNRRISREYSFDSEDIDGLPIELRDLDDVSIGSKEASLNPISKKYVQPTKSKSLSDILGIIHFFLRPKQSTSSMSSGSDSSGSWSMRSLKRKKYLKNGFIKSKSSYGFLARVDNALRESTDLDQPTKCGCDSVCDCKTGSDKINGNCVVSNSAAGDRERESSLPCERIEEVETTGNACQQTGSAAGGGQITEEQRDHVDEAPEKEDGKVEMNLLLFSERCSRLREEKVFEMYYQNRISRFKSMPNLKLRSTTNQAVRKQASLDEQVLLDTCQDRDGISKGWLMSEDNVDMRSKQSDDLDQTFPPASLDCPNRSRQSSVDDSCSQLLNNQRTGAKKHMSCDDTALLSSSGHSRSHLWAVAGRTSLSGFGKPPGALSPRLSTGSSSQQSDTSFDSEDSIISVIAAKPVVGIVSGSRRESHESIEESVGDNCEDLSMSGIRCEYTVGDDKPDSNSFGSDFQISSSSVDEDDSPRDEECSSPQDEHSPGAQESLSCDDDGDNDTVGKTDYENNPLENFKDPLKVDDNGSPLHSLLDQLKLSETDINPLRIKFQESLAWSSGSMDDKQFGKLEFICDDPALGQTESCEQNFPNSPKDVDDDDQGDFAVSSSPENCSGGSDSLGPTQSVSSSEKVYQDDLSSFTRVEEEGGGASEASLPQFQPFVDSFSSLQDSGSVLPENTEAAQASESCAPNLNESDDISDVKVNDGVTSMETDDTEDNKTDTSSRDQCNTEDCYDSSRQNSLSSDEATEDFTFHRYYHVFREGELDQLIENYVDNLHIISSYYDHANWCIIAEKVQVWKI